MAGPELDFALRVEVSILKICGSKYTCGQVPVMTGGRVKRDCCQRGLGGFLSKRKNFDLDGTAFI